MDEDVPDSKEEIVVWSSHFLIFTSYRNRKVRACAHFKNIILLMLIIYFRPKSKIRLKEQVRHLLKHT